MSGGRRVLSCPVEEDRWEGGPEKEWIRKGVGSWPVGLVWEGDNSVERGMGWDGQDVSSRICQFMQLEGALQKKTVGCGGAYAEQKKKKM